VGAWRKKASWNHAKIIAVDGHVLHTGGHNMWDQHYLRRNPIHDLSLELAGEVAHDAHCYANTHWGFVQAAKNTCCGQCLEVFPDWLPLATTFRVLVSEFPRDKADAHPPMYSIDALRRADDPQSSASAGDTVPILTLGRLGALAKKSEPSDCAILAMIGAARKVIRCSLQDVGPMCFPGTKIPLPGTSWPKALLAALGEAIWVRNVQLQMVLSNLGAIPNNLNSFNTYSHGWACTDVAAEIVKAIQRRFPGATAEVLRSRVENNLFLCYLRRSAEENGNQWENGQTLGLHDKHFIIDDVSTYIGSQTDRLPARRTCTWRGWRSGAWSSTLRTRRSGSCRSTGILFGLARTSASTATCRR